MKMLVIVPMQEEIKGFLLGFTGKKGRIEESVIGKLPVVRFPDLNVTVAPGGLGKVQFAVQTQHLLDAEAGWSLVVCAGAAGALVNDLSVGDVVVGTETVEHDIKNKMGKPHLPRYPGDEAAIETLKRAGPVSDSFHARFGPIASGDEDIIDVGRRKALHELTGALAVAWEGAGGARACHFSGFPFVEVRGVTDSADSNAALDFDANLPVAMKHVATLIFSWARALRE